MLGRRISSLEEGEHVDVLLIRRREAAIADIKAETDQNIVARFGNAGNDKKRHERQEATQRFCGDLARNSGVCWR